MIMPVAVTQNQTYYRISSKCCKNARSLQCIGPDSLFSFASQFNDFVCIPSIQACVKVPRQSYASIAYVTAHQFLSEACHFGDKFWYLFRVMFWVYFFFLCCLKTDEISFEYQQAFCCPHVYQRIKLFRCSVSSVGTSHRKVFTSSHYET